MDIKNLSTVGHGNDIVVLFGRREALQTPVPENMVLIVPAETSDEKSLGFEVNVEIHVHSDSASRRSPLSGFLGFLTRASGEPSDVQRLYEILEGAGELTIVATDQHQYFTMLPSMAEYRKLVQMVGPERAEKILKAMKDLVALNEFKTNANWIAFAEDSDVFLKAFIHSSDSYFAFRNAGPILRGLEFESYRVMSSEINLKFQLAGRKTPHVIGFRFDHESDLPKRIAVVIGENGVGKSQALGRIARAALSGGKSLNANNNRLLMNRLLTFCPTNESGSVFPPKSKKARLYYRRFALNRSRAAYRGNGIGDLLIQLVRSDAPLLNMSRWSIFLAAIQGISDWQQIAIPRKGKAAGFVHLSEMTDANNEAELIDRYASIDTRREPVRVVRRIGYPLSSGEISFLRFAAQASLHVENGSLLLLDEPETHLHPSFVSQFVVLLNNLLERTGSAAIIATHSAYFVREVFRDQVTVLRVTSEGEVAAEKPLLHTFGADVGAISYFVFGEDAPSKLAADVAKRLLATYKNWDAMYAACKDDFSTEMLADLRAYVEGEDH